MQFEYNFGTPFGIYCMELCQNHFYFCFRVERVGNEIKPNFEILKFMPGSKLTLFQGKFVEKY